MPTTRQKIQKKNSIKVATYASLRSAVRGTIALGKRRAERAVEREKVRTSWEVGKLILEHIFLNQSRADYGKNVVRRLASDLGLSVRSVRYMVEFAREYPIRHSSAELSFAHYRVLLSINDVKVRNTIEKLAEEKKWTVKELRSKVKAQKKPSKKSSEIKESLKPLPRSPLNVFREYKINGKKWVDLGFSTYVSHKEIPKKAKFVKERRFTYRAEVVRVVDGDTVWCLVDLGLGIKAHQKLRLRGVNAAELKSKAGERAKRYLQRKLPAKRKILMCTTKSDKFDRYLADLWIDNLYLNQQLVRVGHAELI